MPAYVYTFQSAPAIADGRKSSDADYVIIEDAFQSAPAIADGRKSLSHWSIFMTNPFQSAPAIADGRKSSDGVADPPFRQRFNPLPPLLTGERVKQRGPHRQLFCFNPLPPLLTGERGSNSSPSPAFQFQSAPAIADGRKVFALSRCPTFPVVSIRSRHC